MTKPEVLHFIVTPSEAGWRLDRVLAHRIPGLGRKGAARLLSEGHVQVGGVRGKKSLLARAGERVVVELSLTGQAAPARDIPFSVVLSTDELLVVDKPAGVPCAALPGKEEGTLAGAVIAHYPELRGVGAPREPGLVNRLDTFTSGLVLVARSNEMLDLLRRALSEKKLEKKYLAITEGSLEPPEGHVEGWLGPDPHQRRKVAPVAPRSAGAVFCRTNYRRKSTWRSEKETRSLAEVEVHAAYRHQIRAHLASIGHPLVGDVLYGGPEGNIAPRHALHASYIAADTAGLPSFEAESELPSELLELLPGAREIPDES